MYFDESAVNVVDSWLKAAGTATDAEPAATKGKAKTAKKSALATSSLPASTDGRKGLGYEAPPKQKKSKQEEAVDNVLKNIQKQKKKASTVVVDPQELHGMVEEAEISRIKPSSIRVPVNNDKTGSEQKGNDGEQKSKGFSKNAGSKPTFAKNDSFKAQNNSSNPNNGKNKNSASTLETKGHTHNPDHPRNNNKRPLENAQSWGGGMREGQGARNGEGDEPPARKRTKTRSKQKNIRRDRRTEEFKPEHLRIGSEEYCGYPLTEETKGRLGISK